MRADIGIVNSVGSGTDALPVTRSIGFDIHTFIHSSPRQTTPAQPLSFQPTPHHNFFLPSIHPSTHPLPIHLFIPSHQVEYVGGLVDFTGEMGRFAVARATARDVAAVQACMQMNVYVRGDVGKWVDADGWMDTWG